MKCGLNFQFGPLEASWANVLLNSKLRGLFSILTLFLVLRVHHCWL